MLDFWVDSTLQFEADGKQALSVITTNQRQRPSGVKMAGFLKVAQRLFPVDPAPIMPSFLS